MGHFFEAPDDMSFSSLLAALSSQQRRPNAPRAASFKLMLFRLALADVLDAILEMLAVLGVAHQVAAMVAYDVEFFRGGRGSGVFLLAGERAAVHRHDELGGEVARVARFLQRGEKLR